MVSKNHSGLAISFYDSITESITKVVLVWNIFKYCSKLTAKKITK